MDLYERLADYKEEYAKALQERETRAEILDGLERERRDLIANEEEVPDELEDAIMEAEIAYDGAANDADDARIALDECEAAIRLAEEE